MGLSETKKEVLTVMITGKRIAAETALSLFRAKTKSNAGKAELRTPEPDTGHKVVDLFSGVGGLSLGFQQAGFATVAAYDAWAPAVDCYRANFNHPVYEFDLLDVEAAIEHVSAFKPDVIIGGPPCQDFSSAGKRSEGQNASLTDAYADIVTGCRPRIAVMENVPRARASAAFSRAYWKLSECGYKIFRAVLDASRCGVPQTRKRFFCIAWKNGQSRTELNLNEYFHDAQSGEPLTVREYMGDEIDFDHYYRHPRNYSRRAVFSVDEPSPTIRGVNRPVAPNYRGHPLDTAPAAAVRPLTTHERSRIQTFPQDWNWPADRTKTDTEQLVGNAVPVELGKFVAEGIQEALW